MKALFSEVSGLHSLLTWDDSPSLTEARYILQDIAHTSDGVRNLRRVLWELYVEDCPADLDDQEVIELLAKNLASGSLRVWATPVEIPSIPLNTSKQAEHLEVIEPIGESNDWIEIQLIGEDGAGIPGERVIIKPPRGRTREFRSNHDGVVRLEGVTSGMCEISFPDLDEEAWIPA